MIASPGKIIVAIDFGQLEDRVIANISNDAGKQAIFLNNLDSHCYNALGYFKDEIASKLPLTGDVIVDTKMFKSALHENKELQAIRQNGKPCTFAISYGAYPPKIATTIKCDMDTATSIFNAYHKELYPGVSKFKTKVLDLTDKNGYTHMGLGARMYTDNVEKYGRTIFNSASQFWSILTMISLAEIHKLTIEAQMDTKIKPIATIYDSIYFEVDNDPEVVKWLNNNLIPIMTKQWIKDEVVHNTASIEVGLNWANLNEIRNNASIEEIIEILGGL